MSAWGWPLPLAGPWLRVGTPRRKGAGRVGVQARPPLSPHLLLRGPVGTHPPHGGPEALCQAPQAAQVPLEAAQFEGRGLGPSARALRSLGGRGRLLPPPQASSCHKEQVTQEQLHGLGMVGRAGVTGGAPALGGEGWGPAVPGAGSGLHCRGTAPASLTCNATAMHRGAARLSRPPHLPPAAGAASKEGSARPPTPTLVLPVGNLRAGPTLPGTQASARKARLAGPPVLCCWANPTTVFCNPRKNIPGMERQGLPAPPGLPGPRHQPSPCQWGCQPVWWPGCPAGTRWPSHRRRGWPDQTLPSRGPGGPGQP